MVPAGHHPLLFNGNVERHNGVSTLLCQVCSSRFGEISRTARSVDRKSQIFPCLHRPQAFHCRLMASARARAASSSIPETLDDARNVFAIAIPARHYDDTPVAKKIGGRENPAVPESKDKLFARGADGLCTLRFLDFPAKGCTDQAYSAVSQSGDQADFETV